MKTPARPTFMPTFMIVLALVLAAPFAAQDEVESDDEPRIFSVPDARDTRELAATAQKHLDENRTGEAIAALQEILEQHRADVLAAERNTYPGAARWAEARLVALPLRARGDYLARYEPRARAALERARAEGDPTALIALAARWPITDAARTAWWTLGDIELEGGHVEGARLAWRRAVDLAQRLEASVPASGAARLAWLESHAATSAAEPASARLPRGDAAPSWITSLDLRPFGPRNSQSQTNYNLLPLVSEGHLYVASSLYLYALDVFTGVVGWQAGPPLRWTALSPRSTNELFAGLNYDLIQIAPAAGDGVVVAAMQEPFSEDSNLQWQSIEIMRAIPERRLHAYDAATGRELWNHSPPLTPVLESDSDGRQGDEKDGSARAARQVVQGWHFDGTGTYAQRMMVAASPVVAGTRVLVPCYRMQGRVDYHVACYALDSGALLWSTPVISGQRERNMFGRSTKEFAATPVVVVGDRVIAQTELGTVAALDLFTGQILWQTRYRQIPLPRTHSYATPPRTLTWQRLTPPVVVGELIVATPSDSNEIGAYALADGHQLWHYTEDALQRLDREHDGLHFKQLVGADQDTVYLAGQKLGALQKPGGLASTAAPQLRWAQPLERETARAVLTPEAVLVPSANARTAFDRRTGTQLAALSGPWGRGEAGNVWIEAGALFSLSSQGVSGYFDWQAMLERARLAAESADTSEPVRRAAELFQRCGELALERRDLDEARERLRSAAELHARARKNGALAVSPAELACARSLAETLALSGRDAEALEVLGAALALGPSGDELCGLLFQEERLLRDAGGARRVAVLDRLSETCQDLPLPASVWAGSAPTWLAGTAAADEKSRATTSPPPTALWVAVERAGESVRAGDLGAALTGLHSVLARARGIQLANGVTLASVVKERIARVLALSGARAAFAPLEARAAELLAAARAGRAELDQVAELYPCSEAAAAALHERLEHAVKERDSATVAALVADALASGGRSAQEECGLLLRLASVLASRGNEAYQRGLLTSLARENPGLVSDLPEHGAKTLGALASELGAEETLPSSPAAFDPHVVASGAPHEGQYEFLGAIEPARAPQESAPRTLHVYLVRSRLEAYSSAAPAAPAWTRELGGVLSAESCAFASGRMFYALRDGLHCLDERGQESWTRATGDEPTKQLAEASGVLLAHLRSGRVLALDSTLGTTLWERTLGEGGNWSGPLLGRARAVFFSESHAVAPRALVFDLYRGRVVADVRLSGFEGENGLLASAWIAGERLLVPAFKQQPTQISAFLLDGGRRLWTAEFGRDENLYALAHCEGQDYPITVAASLGNAAGNGGVYALDAASGDLKRIVPLRPGERVLGLAPKQRTEIAAPYLFACASAEGERGVPIRAIHLPYGLLWTWSLPVGAKELYDRLDLPLPAVSADCVAIAYQTGRASGPGNETTIVFVDKRAGKKLDSLVLGGAFEFARALELRGLGEALFVLGKGPSQRGFGLEVLEAMR